MKEKYDEKYGISYLTSHLIRTFFLQGFTYVAPSVMEDLYKTFSGSPEFSLR